MSEYRNLQTVPLAQAAAEPGPTIIRPVATAAEIRAAWQQLQELKQQLLTPDDYQAIQDRQYIKKSGWRKIAAAFGLSLELLTEHRHELDGGGWVWQATVRAIAPNGRHSDGLGSCHSAERRFAHAHHDTRATAYTRAANRAISDLVGGGEVSAEEAEMLPAELPAPTRPATRASSPPPKLTAEQIATLAANAHEHLNITPDQLTRILRQQPGEPFDDCVRRYCSQQRCDHRELYRRLKRLIEDGEQLPGLDQEP